MVTGGINQAIQKHARTSLDWKHQGKADKAYTIFGAINDFLYEQNLPTVIIGFDNRLKKAGEYYFEGDNISLKHHFDMRDDLTELETVISVLHNAVHAFQDVHKPKRQWYHPASFGKEMAQWGLNVNKNGDIVSIDPDTFSEVLERIGRGSIRSELLDFEPVEATDITTTSPSAAEYVTKANITKAKATVNKMKKWSCACNPPINVRCAVNLTAYCTECNADFEKMEA